MEVSIKSKAKFFGKFSPPPMSKIYQT